MAGGLPYYNSCLAAPHFSRWQVLTSSERAGGSLAVHVRSRMSRRPRTQHGQGGYCWQVAELRRVLKESIAMYGDIGVALWNVRLMPGLHHAEGAVM